MIVQCRLNLCGENSEDLLGVRQPGQLVGNPVRDVQYLVPERPEPIEGLYLKLLVRGVGKPMPALGGIY